MAMQTTMCTATSQKKDQEWLFSANPGPNLEEVLPKDLLQAHLLSD